MVAQDHSRTQTSAPARTAVQAQAASRRSPSKKSGKRARAASSPASEEPSLEVQPEPPSPEPDMPQASLAQAPLARAAISPGAFYKSVHEESQAIRQGPSAMELELSDLRKRVTQLERWAEMVESREKMMISKKLATTLQMPKQSLSEDQYWLKCGLDGISYPTVKCAPCPFRACEC